MNQRLLKKYQSEIVPLLQKKWKINNPLAVPKLKKIVINVGITDEQHRDEALKNMSEQIALFTGQKPIICRAKQSIAGFKVRQGDPIGLKVTLRHHRMYDFFDKLVNIVLPQVKDFQGVKRHAFDNQGNYSLGLTEQIIFPEVDYDKIDKVRGLQITMTTTAANNKKARQLLSLLGMPFAKKKTKKSK